LGRKWKGIIGDKTEERRVLAMQKAKLVDLATIQEMLLRRPMPSFSRIAWACNVGTAIVVQIHRGLHWQQDGDKVRIFNDLHKTTIPEETGVPSKADLEKFGVATAESREKKREDLERKRAKQKERAAEKRAEAVMLGGKPVIRKERPPLTLKLDTAYFKDQVDEALWRLLRQFDDAKIGAMSGKELSAAISSFLEKRALLRGEPTQIVSSGNRQALEVVGELLVQEMVRRGRKLPGIIDVTPREAVAESAP